MSLGKIVGAGDGNVDGTSDGSSDGDDDDDGINDEDLVGVSLGYTDNVG